VALIAARQQHSGAALVVLAGTATTIDQLDASGRFCGGVILPGLDLMQRALARHTADLPLARGQFCATPTNTDDAIVSGARQATLGAIERLAAPLCRPASADFCCLLSGGAAPQLAPHLDVPLRCIDNLVLEGLAVVASRAQQAI
jgi:type III pantothenate kinase